MLFAVYRHQFNILESCTLGYMFLLPLKQRSDLHNIFSLDHHKNGLERVSVTEMWVLLPLHGFLCDKQTKHRKSDTALNLQCEHREKILVETEQVVQTLHLRLIFRMCFVLTSARSLQANAGVVHYVR
jgi:hypothetical protein